MEDVNMKEKRVKTLFAVAGMVFILLFGVWIDLSYAAKDIKVGLVFPRSGSLARLGETTMFGALMAIEDVNKAGGIKSLGGAKLVAVVGDAKDAAAARSETERMITREGVVALLGVYSSSFTLIATETSERQKIPFFTNSIADNILQRGFKYVFRMSVPANEFGKTPIDGLMRMAEAFGKPVKKIAILYEDTSYGTSTSESFLKRAKEKGLNVVLYEAYRAGLTDAGPLVNKIKASGAEVIFPVSYVTDAILIIRTMKETNTNAAIFGGGSGYLMPDSVGVMGNDINYIFTTACWNHDLPYKHVADINSRYEKKHKEFIQETAGEMYSAIWVLKDALERSGSTNSVKLRDAIAATNLSSGPACIIQPGKIRFDATGQLADIFPLLLQWQNGKLKTVWPNKLGETKPIWPVPAWNKR